MSTADEPPVGHIPGVIAPTGRTPVTAPAPTRSQVGSAWAVHGFTALGIVAAMLALRDVLVNRPSYAIMWLLLTLLIDGVDGPMARALRVSELVPRIEELKRRYDSRQHASPATAAANAALVDELGLTSYLAQQSTIAGPIERCIDRLHEVAAAGVRQIIVAQFVPDPMTFMKTFAARVLPEFS